MRRCPVPGCEREAPRGCVFCPDHYFELPRGLTRLIFRMQFEAERCTDPERKAYLQDQLRSYVKVAIKHLPGQREAANG